MSSRLNFSRNIFLEKEELVKFQDFLLSDSFSKMILGSTLHFGIVDSGTGESCKVVQGSQPQYIAVNPGVIATKSKNIIEILSKQDNILIPNDGAYYYVRIQPQEVRYEDGFVEVNPDGSVNASGNIDFSKIVRGQSGSVPSMVRFVKESDGVITDAQNNGIYEVVSLGAADTDGVVTSIQLTTNQTFVREENLRMIVLGSLPLTYEFTDEQLGGLYFYDRYRIYLTKATVTSPIVPPLPQGLVDQNMFVLAVVRNVNNVISITDARGFTFYDTDGTLVDGQYWAFQSIGGTAGGDLTGTYPNPRIAPGAVDEEKLADNSVGSRALKDASVTNPKIAPGAVGNTSIADGAVGYEHLNESAKLYDLVIDSNEKLALLSTTEARSVFIKAGVYSFAGTGSGDGLQISNFVQRIDCAANVEIIISNIGTNGSGIWSSNARDILIKNMVVTMQSGRYAFHNINHLHDCKTNSSFYECDYLEGCVANRGFVGCEHLTLCRASVTSGNAYSDCNYLFNCTASIVGRSASAVCFNNCTVVIGCVAFMSTEGSISGLGYSGCKKVQQCSVVGADSVANAYSSSYASSTASSSYACADTPAGGFNSLDTSYLISFVFRDGTTRNRAVPAGGSTTAPIDPNSEPAYTLKYWIPASGGSNVNPGMTISNVQANETYTGFYLENPFNAIINSQGGSGQTTPTEWPAQLGAANCIREHGTGPDNWVYEDQLSLSVTKEEYTKRFDVAMYLSGVGGSPLGNFDPENATQGQLKLLRVYYMDDDIQVPISEVMPPQSEVINPGTPEEQIVQYLVFEANGFQAATYYVLYGYILQPENP